MMLNYLAKRLTMKLMEDNIITDDLKDIYMYGFELLLSSLFCISIIIVIGILFNIFLETIDYQQHYTL